MKEIEPKFKKEKLSLVDQVVDFTTSQISHWKNIKQFNDLRSRDYIYTLKGFDDLKCIFVHIPKSAGVSINRELFGNLGGAHRTVRTYKRIFGPVTFDRYFKFTFVRNPYSRLLSAFRFLKTGGFCDKDKQWAEENLSEFENFGDFVELWLNEESILKYNHFVPQYMFVCDKTFQPEVDFIGRFESIDEDFDKICRKLNISRHLEMHNEGPEKIEHWSSFYNAEIKDKVYDIYRKDFEIFGYSRSLEKVLK